MRPCGDRRRRVGRPHRPRCRTGVHRAADPAAGVIREEYAMLVTVGDAIDLRKSDNGPMAARGIEPFASLLRDEPQAPPSGWALAVDAAVAVCLAVIAAF